jgi:hypothetical protein
MTWIHAVVAVVLPLQGPVQSPDVTSNTKAALQLVVNALGGGRLHEITSVVATGKINVPLNGTSKTGTVLWKNTRSDFRYETTGEELSEVLISGRGQAANVRAEKTTKLHGHVALAHVPPHLPGMVLESWLADARGIVGSKPSFEAIKEEKFKGKPVFVFEMCDQAEETVSRYTHQRWLIDGTTSLPVAVIHQVPDHSNAGDLTSFREELSDYRFIDGVAIPFHIETYIQERLAMTIDLDRVEFNRNVVDSDFEIPTGAER